MTLHDYMRGLTPQEREEFAQRCDTTVNYLWKVARGFDRGLRPSGLLAARIEAASNQKVRRWESNPEAWAETWPELVGAPGAPVLLSAVGVA